MSDQDQNRRRFLAFIAGSPLLLAQQNPDAIADPKQALNVMDFEEPARRKMMPGHWAYTSSGVDDDFSVEAPVEIQFAKGASQTIWVETSSSAATFSATLKQVPTKVSIPAGRGVLALKK